MASFAETCVVFSDLVGLRRQIREARRELSRLEAAEKNAEQKLVSILEPTPLKREGQAEMLPLATRSWLRLQENGRSVEVLVTAANGSIFWEEVPTSKVNTPGEGERR